MMQTIAMTQTQMHAHMNVLSHSLSPVSNIRTTSHTKRSALISSPTQAHAHPIPVLPHTTPMKIHQDPVLMLDAMPAIKFYLRLLKDQRHALQQYGIVTPGAKDDEAQLSLQTDAELLDTSTNYGDGRSAVRSDRRTESITQAQHHEQLRMRGIQPSRRTNEIHTHIAPVIDTSVKHVIASAVMGQ